MGQVHRGISEIGLLLTYVWYVFMFFHGLRPPWDQSHDSEWLETAKPRKKQSKKIQVKKIQSQEEQIKEEQS